MGGQRRAAEEIVVNVRHPKAGQHARAVGFNQKLIGLIVGKGTNCGAVGHRCRTASTVMDHRHGRSAVAVAR